jgi:demethylmenaquinone methyltransferase/2-methoxy-6-polyprenyl-1,4-benzoquinol methylase
MRNLTKPRKKKFGLNWGCGRRIQANRHCCGQRSRGSHDHLRRPHEPLLKKGKGQQLKPRNALERTERLKKEPALVPPENKEEMADFGFRRVPAGEKGKFVLRHFNSIARKYDFMNTLLSFGLHYLWKKWAVKSVQLKPGDKIIDVCGGTGDLSILAAEIIGPEGKAFLYDINRAMIEGGKPKIAKAFLSGRVVYVQGDAESISFPQGCFDAAMVGFGVRNLTRMEKGLAEMYRVLKLGGKLMCLEFSLPTSIWFRWLYDIYSFRLMPLLGKLLAGTREAYLYLPESIRRFPLPDEFTGMLRKVGFSRVHCRRLTNGIAVIYTGEKKASV